MVQFLQSRVELKYLAKQIGVTVDKLVLAVFTMEVRLDKWGVEQRRREAGVGRDGENDESD